MGRNACVILFVVVVILISPADFSNRVSGVEVPSLIDLEIQEFLTHRDAFV